MASIKSSLYVVALLVVCDVIRGAPVQTPENEVKASAVNNQVSDVGTQEREIQDLLNLVKSQTQDRPVSVQHQEQTHVQNINGQVSKVQEKEEKVIDTDRNQVVADVKQTVQQLPSGGDGAPQVQVETKVDIPSAGIHETIENQQTADDSSSEHGVSPDVQSAAEAVLDNDINNMRQEVDASANGDESLAGSEEQEELTPADMAAFLYETQQLDAFYPALKKLVNESKMTPEEAEAYAEEVVLQYQQLQLRDFEMDAFAQKRDALPLDLYGQQQLPAGLDSYARQPLDTYSYNEGYPSPQEQYMMQLQLQQQQQQQLQDQGQQYVYNSELGFDPLDFLTVLYEAAYGKDNAEAREILRLLYDRVSRDDNPDDLDQIRDLLIETVASSLGDEGDERSLPWDAPPMVQSLPINMPEFDLANVNGFDDPRFVPAVPATQGDESLDDDSDDNQDDEGSETSHDKEGEGEGEEEVDLEAQLSNMNGQVKKRDDETANPVGDNNNDGDDNDNNTEESSNNDVKSEDSGEDNNESDSKGKQ